MCIYVCVFFFIYPRGKSLLREDIMWYHFRGFEKLRHLSFCPKIATITLQMTQVGNKEAFKKCFEMFLWAQSSQGSRVGFTWPFQSMAKKEWHFFSTVQKNYTFPHRTSLECLLAIESRGELSWVLKYCITVLCEK